jgi:acyl-CoA dehydrogenase
VDFGFDSRTEQLRAQLLDFMDAHVYPAEPVLADQAAQAAADLKTAWTTPPIVEDLKAEARRRGL